MYEKNCIFQQPKWRPSKAAFRGHRSSFFILSLSLSLSLVEPRICFAAHGRGASFPPLVHPPPPQPRCRLLFLRPFEGEAAPRASRCFICLSALFITCNLALARARVISYWFSASFHTLPYSPPPLVVPYFLASFFFLPVLQPETSYEVMLPRTERIFRLAK